jgi:hypothetical protein
MAHAKQSPTQAASAASVNDSPDFTLPTRAIPAPVTLDPYMRPESVTAETLSYGGVDLPPILTGYEPGKDFEGKTLDYPVKVIHITRRHIEAVLSAIGREHPELETVLAITSKYMCTLDTQRSEMGLGVACAKSWLKGNETNPDRALQQLDGVSHLVGNWNDSHRLHLR